MSNEFKCKKCGSESYMLQQKGTSTGLYCAKCGFWHKWLGKQELRVYKAQELSITKPTKEDIIDNIIECLFNEGVIINGIKYDRILEVPYLIIIEYEYEYIEKLMEAFDRVLEIWEE